VDAKVFALEAIGTELAKLYVEPGRQDRLQLLGRHLNRALEAVTSAVPGAPLVARPTYELYERPEGGKPAGFMMHNFDPQRDWRSLEEAGLDPALSQSPEWCLTVARTLARDVAYFHSRFLVVGDLSDTNVRVDHRGAVAWIDVDSFGALACNGLGGVDPLGSTPECRAPELITGRQPGTQESDSFALALQVVRLLTCRFLHPFAIERIDATGMRTIEDRVEDLDSWILDPAHFKTSEIPHRGADAWPEALAATCRAALSRDGIRPAASQWMVTLDAIYPRDLHAALLEPMPEASSAFPPDREPPPTPRRLRRALARAAVALIVIGAVAVALAALGGVAILNALPVH